MWCFDVQQQLDPESRWSCRNVQSPLQVLTTHWRPNKVDNVFYPELSRGYRAQRLVQPRYVSVCVVMIDSTAEILLRQILEILAVSSQWARVLSSRDWRRKCNQSKSYRVSVSKQRKHDLPGARPKMTTLVAYACRLESSAKVSYEERRSKLMYLRTNVAAFFLEASKLSKRSLMWV